MARKKIKIGDNEFEVNTSGYWLVLFGIVIIIVLATFAMSFFTIDANERGVILRFGKYHRTTMPGLHWKMPWNIEKLYKVKVDYQYKEEFGFRTLRAGVQSRYSSDDFSTESWVLNGDLKITDIKWTVQYRIGDPVAVLFNVKDVSETIRNISESVIREIVGDRSFHETLQLERVHISDMARQQMQEILDRYNIGITVKMVQLKDVLPPEPVRDSFNEVNRAKQEQETMINEAQRAYNKEVFKAEGEAKKIIQEAQGYAINRTNNAEGDANFFNSVFETYQKAQQITQKRLYIETMEEVMKKVKNKYIIDEDLGKGVLPFLNMTGKEASK
ncbi:MAG: FtsH protease activity modulator HflK [Candidatus Marinimicrobia bacterium]|nr:FtsH protease activity modulator HflK [Candidatus Neomarinimicrobiota bacterium]